MGERTRKTAKMNDFILAEASFAKRNWSFRFFEEKKQTIGLFICEAYGGSERIRTSETFLPTRFRVVRLQPLGHASTSYSITILSLICTVICNCPSDHDVASNYSKVPSSSLNYKDVFSWLLITNHLSPKNRLERLSWRHRPYFKKPLMICDSACLRDKPSVISFVS